MISTSGISIPRADKSVVNNIFNLCVSSILKFLYSFYLLFWDIFECNLEQEKLVILNFLKSSGSNILK